MDDKDIDNIHAWLMLQKGKASPADQVRAFEIHKALLNEEKRKRYYVTTARNLLLDLMIHREGIDRGVAYEILSTVEGLSLDQIRKPYNEWEKMPSGERRVEAERYFNGRSNFIDIEEQKEKTRRITEAIRQRGF